LRSLLAGVIDIFAFSLKMPPQKYLIMTEKAPVTVRVSGHLVVAEDMHSAKMYEVVRVGDKGILGEVIRLENGLATIQVYEDTSGLGAGEPVERTEKMLLVELGPGLLESVYDGLQRPLCVLEEKSGRFLAQGILADGLDHEKRWDFLAKVSVGDTVSEGDILGTVQETSLIEHRILVPWGVKTAKIESIKNGKFTVLEVVAVLSENGKKREVEMRSFWPLRKSRPVKSRRLSEELFSTGVRGLDTLFPLVKGGAACIAGQKGTGKTVLQEELAKRCDAQVVVFVGCGERGNEVAQRIQDFSHFPDPSAGEPLARRTVMISTTADGPLLAHEPALFMGMTIAEYYRDMGYHVAVLADSLSSLTGKSEMAELIERAGAVNCLATKKRTGTLTFVGSVSSSGDKVLQNMLPLVKTFWKLGAALARKRHFPSLDWSESYSLSTPNPEKFIKETEVRVQALAFLQEEFKLQKTLKMVGREALSLREKLALATTKSIREDFLKQDFGKNIAPQKPYEVLKAILGV
jgi:V/A-type H+-transporting ATPase subunit A